MVSTISIYQSVDRKYSCAYDGFSSLVAAGFGVALTLECFRILHRPGVIYRSLENPRESIVFAVAWRREDESPALHNFLETVREVAG